MEIKSNHLAAAAKSQHVSKTVPQKGAVGTEQTESKAARNTDKVELSKDALALLKSTQNAKPGGVEIKQLANTTMKAHVEEVQGSDTEDDKILLARKRISEGFYNSKEVTNRIATGLMKDMKL